MPVDAATPVAHVTWQDRDLTAALLAVDVEDHDRLTDKATVVLDDLHGVLAAAVAPGQRLTVALGWGQDVTVVFDGLVRTTTAEADATGARTVVVAHDPAWLMHREPVVEDHVGSLEQVVRKLAGRHPTPVGHVEVDPGVEFGEDRPLRQHGRTDLELLQELAHRVRARAFVEVNEGANRFYWVPVRRLLEAEPVAALHAGPDTESLVDFRYRRLPARAAAQALVSVVDPAAGEVREGAGALVPPPRAATVDQDRAGALGREASSLRAVYESAVAAAATTPPQAAPPVRVLGLPADPWLADAALVPDPATAEGLVGEGRLPGDPRLRAKSVVEVDGVAPWAVGRWYVSSVVHAWRAPGAADRQVSPYECRLQVTR